MSGMPRMTVSAPRKVLQEFVWLCHRRQKSASEVLREFMQDFVDSRFAEIEARDSAHELCVFDEGALESRGEDGQVALVHCEAAACGPRGCDP
jgi:hypothetical protein